MKRLLTTLVVFISLSVTAYAQGVPETCDADLFESMKAKAHLEAQRDMIQAQNTLTQPQDVHELTCNGNIENCHAMSEMWTQVQCKNFAEDTENQGFFTFEEYSNSPDKRKLPNGNRCEPQKDITWENAMAVADLPPEQNLPDVKEIQQTTKGIFEGDCDKTLLVDTGVGFYDGHPGIDGGERKINICASPHCYYNIHQKKCMPL